MINIDIYIYILISLLLRSKNINVISHTPCMSLCLSVTFLGAIFLEFSHKRHEIYGNRWTYGSPQDTSFSQLDQISRLYRLELFGVSGHVKKTRGKNDLNSGMRIHRGYF